jgi:hypothetical protein
MNNSTSAQSVTFTFSGATVSSVHKYTSSQSKNGADDGTVTATNNSFTASLDAQSVTTFVSAGTVPVIMAPMHAVEKERATAVTSNFIYLVNGKRMSVPGFREYGKPIPGIYVMPGHSQVGIEAGKALKTKTSSK